MKTSNNCCVTLPTICSISFSEKSEQWEELECGWTGKSRDGEPSLRIQPIRTVIGFQKKNYSICKQIIPQ